MLGMYTGTKQSYSFGVEQEMEDFITFYQYVDDRIKADTLTFKGELCAEFDMEGQFSGFSGPTDELYKLYNAPSILYHSVFISLYSFFELKLTHLINDYAARKTLKIFLADLKSDNEINKVEKYLNKVLDIDLSDMKPVFNSLHEYRKIRNAFIHYGGFINKNDIGKGLFTKIRQNPSFSFSISSGQTDSGYISIKESTFISEFANFIPKFLGEVFSKLYPLGVTY